MARENSVYGVGGTQLVIAPGATNALYVLPEAGEISSSLAWVSGGSAMIMPVPRNTNPMLFARGQTWLGASLVAYGSSANAFPVSATATYNIDGPAQYYVMAFGSTAVIAKMVGYSQS